MTQAKKGWKEEPATQSNALHTPDLPAMWLGLLGLGAPHLRLKSQPEASIWEFSCPLTLGPGAPQHPHLSKPCGLAQSLPVQAVLDGVPAIPHPVCVPRLGGGPLRARAVAFHQHWAECSAWYRAGTESVRWRNIFTFKEQLVSPWPCRHRLVFR